MNWKDLFGKKKIAELKKANHELRKQYEELQGFYQEQTRISGIKNKLRVRKYAANIWLTERTVLLNEHEELEYIKGRLAIKLAHELQQDISYTSSWDNEMGCNVCTAFIEVLGGDKE